MGLLDALKLKPKGRPAAGGPGGAGKALVEKAIDDKVDGAIDDAGKTLRQLNKDTMPGFADVFEEMSPEDAFFVDMDNGLRNAKAQIEFIEKTLAYAEKVGTIEALAPIAEASRNLQKISGGVLAGLGKTGKVLSTAKQVVGFYRALQGFAAASQAMNADQGKSVEAWVGSVKKLWNASKPFVDMAKDKAFAAALAGSPAAAAFGATLAVVGAQLYLGIQTLDRGVKNVNAYFERLHRMTREGPDGIVGDRPEAPPERPVAPLSFSTRAETLAGLKRHDEEEQRKKALREQNAQDAQKEENAAKALETYNETTFPLRYLKYREAIKAKIYAAYRKAGGGGARPESEWWDCLVGTDEPVSDEPSDAPLSDGIDIEPRKSGIDAGDAEIEVRQFLELSKPCPYFDLIYQGELKKHRAGR